MMLSLQAERPRWRRSAGSRLFCRCALRNDVDACRHVNTARQNSAVDPSPIPLSEAANSAVGGPRQIASKILIYLMFLTPEGCFSGAGTNFSPVDSGNSDDALAAQGGMAASAASSHANVLRTRSSYASIAVFCAS